MKSFSQLDNYTDLLLSSLVNHYPGKGNQDNLDF